MSLSAIEMEAPEAVAEVIEQGTDAWHALRCGKATASRIADIMRRTKSGPSKDRERYLGELVSERLTGIPRTGFKSADMKWGNDTEPEARSVYEMMTGHTLTAVAFIDHPRIDMSGCSPDRLVNNDGLLEIKCPATHTHIATLRGAPIDPDYMTQMQWQMACTGRSWCDFVSYDPRLPPEMSLHCERVLRDSARIVEMEKAVKAFLAEVDAVVADLKARFGGDM